ncbi:PH-like domain-containing protein [Streptomyces sparsus]
MHALAALADGAAEPRSQEVTDWAARIGWVVGLLLFIALVYWLMREGWKWRGTLQGNLPEPAAVPAAPAAPDESADARPPADVLLTGEGRYHGSTRSGQWLDRIVAHGLGTRSRVSLTLTAEGLTVLRPGARDFFVPAADLRGARLDTGIAGKVLTEGGLLVVVWQLGDTLLDSGFRLDHAAEHGAWLAAVDEISGGSADAAAPHDPQIEEGAR